MLKRVVFLCLFPLVCSAQKTLSLDDRSYEWQIKTVQLYPNLGGPRDYLQPAVVPLERQNLVLEFDDIQ
ncbi:MAG: hypothetical protein ACK5BJ_12520, partial [Bacteroidota bacterium]